MSRGQVLDLNERISGIRSTLDELDLGLNPGLGSFDSSARPSLLRGLDSVSSRASDQSMERFLAQQRERDRYRVEERRLPAVPEKAVDFSQQEEDRPLAGLPARWDGTFNRSYSPPSPHSLDFSESKQQPRPPGLEAASREEVIENLSQLQSQLYMQLAECQRELDYSKSFNKEQETQHELRIKELETALREALQGRDRRENSIVPRLREAETQLSEANHRVKSWEDRCVHAEERVRRLEDQLRVIEERNKGLEERNRQLEGEQRSLTQDFRRQREALNTSDTIAAESRKAQQDLRSVKDRLTAAEALVADLQQENRQVTVLSDLVARKEQEVARAYEEKLTAEQRVVDLSARLRQHEDQAQKVLDQRIRQAESRLQEHWSRPVSALEARIAQLTADKENLGLELQSRPSSRYVRDLQSKLTDLEERFSRDLLKRRRTQSVTPTRHRKPTLSKSFEAGPNHAQLVHQVMRELREDHSSGLLDRVRELKQASDLVHKLGKLLVECSPPGTEQPSLRRIWRWVRSVVEDLVRLRGKS